jgi:glutamine amidotransferase
MKKKITIVDYGAGNILSVSRAFNECNASVEIQSDPKKIKNASFLVLPGDGSFSYASNRLKKTNIFEILKKHFEKGNPLLGICLGMQMLLSKSEEFGNNIGLSIIKGKIKKIKKQKKIYLKIPVIGWHPIITEEDQYKNQPLKINKFNSKKFYFVHSYKAIPDKKKEILAYYKYGTEKITAIVGRDNVIGSQFHPEKSGQNGINLIKTFLKIN